MTWRGAPKRKTGLRLLSEKSIDGLKEITYWDAINGVYREFFGQHKPARIVVPVPALHFGCLAEIEAVAEMRKED